MGEARQRPSRLQRWRRLYRRDELDWLRSLVLALVCVAVATAVRFLLGLLGPTLAFATFFPAVMICALVSGRRAGYLSIALSVLVVWWTFIEPYYSFSPLNRVVIANFVVFSLSSLAIIWLALVHRQLVFDFEDKERERQILAREIERRSNNLVSVIGSMVRQTVSNKAEAVALLNRLHVVASGHDLLEGSKPRGLRELLEAAVCRANGKQVVLNGQDVRLTSDQTRSLALVFHEMTTNALKFGALSRREGKVTIDWTDDGGVLRIVWCEVDGPAVSAPAKFNFGSKLITSMLKQISAELEPTFAETGYCYRISIPNADPERQVDGGETGTILHNLIPGYLAVCRVGGKVGKEAPHDPRKSTEV